MDNSDRQSTRQRQLRIVRGKEAGAKTCEATYRNVIEGRVTEASGPTCTDGTLVGEAVPSKVTR